MSLRSGFFAFAAACLLSSGFVAPSGAATTWTVDLLADENDSACVATDCSLREALAGAASGDTIEFALPGSPPWTIRLATALGPLSVTTAVAVVGPGASSLTLSGDADADGDGDLRLIEVSATGALTLSDTRLEFGLATASATRDGGCIRNLGSLALIDVELAGCWAWSGTGTTFTAAAGGSGGAIWNGAGATLTVLRGRFTGNAAGSGASSIDGMSQGPAGGAGGAIANAGSATVVDSTFTANHGGRGGFPYGVGGDGGALANLAGGTLRLDGSTLSGNFSGDSRCEAFGSARDGRGGGLYSAGETAVNDSTLSGNRTGDVVNCSSQAAIGGALAVAGATTRLRNATVAGNTASGNGGGVARESGTLRARNGVVAENAGAGVNDDCWTSADAGLVSEGYNVVGKRDGCAASLTATGDQTGTTAAPLAAGIGALAANGGPTETRALLEGSVAIDAGDPAGCLAWDPFGAADEPTTADQRGEPRPLDGDGDSLAVCDGGSFEAPVPPPPQSDLTVAVAGSGGGSVESDPAGILCPGDCAETYLASETVGLQATPAVGSVFAGWSGDCAGAGACSLAMSSDRSVTATFTAERTLTVALAGDGTGGVASDDLAIGCPGDCSEVYLDGATPTLAATADPGSLFAGWSGDCAGTGSCPLAMTADRSVTATFVDPEVLTVTLAGDGSGEVTSDLPGIACPGDCTEAFTGGESLELAAAPAPGSFFAGWSGDCSGTVPACPLEMSADRGVAATFLLLALFTDGFESANVCLWDFAAGAPPCP